MSDNAADKSDEEPSIAEWLARLDEEPMPGQAGPPAAAQPQRLVALRLAQQRLRDALRPEGPTIMELGEYALGLLSGSQRAALELRLARLPGARQELEEIRRYLDFPPAGAADPSSTPGLFEQVRILVAELMRGAGSAAPAFAFRDQAAPVGARPGDAPAPHETLTYRAGDLLLTLDVDEDSAPGDRVLTGLIIGADEGAFTLARLARSDTPQDNAPEFTSEIDELGNFTVAGIVPGTYDLALRGDGVEIRAAAIHI
jgi:hypothetical protein